MKREPLGVLIHGAGWVSTQHIAAFQRNPASRVAAISSRQLSSARRRAEEAGLSDVGLYDDFERALRHDGVDIVCLCTPQHLHCENTLAAAAAGKQIVIEKPVANNLDELRRMRDAVRTAGVQTVVSFVLRWNPLFETIKSLIADDFLGKLYYCEADYQHNIGSRWSGFEDARTRAKGVSSLLTGGCHAVDAVRWFLGDGPRQAADPVEVFAYRGGWRKGRTEQYDGDNFRWVTAPPLEYEDLEVVLIKFANGAVGKVTANYGCVMPYTFPLEVFGDRGTVRDDRIWSHKFPGQRDWIRIPTILPDSADVAHHPFQGQIDHFVQCVREDEPSHCDLEDAVKTHEVIFAAQQCYETGRPVPLPLLADDTA